MNKKGVGSLIISLIIIAVVEYTVFSLGANSVVTLIGIPIISSVLCTASGKRTFVIDCIFASAMSLLTAVLSGYSTEVRSLTGFVIAFFQLHLPAVVFAVCLSKYKFSLKQTVIAVSGANVLVTIADLAVIKYLHKIDITKQVNDFFTEFSDTYISVIANTELSQGLNADALDEMMGVIKSVFLTLMPGILVLTCVIMSFVTFKIICVILRNLTKVDIDPRSKLRFFTIEGSLSLVTFILILLSFVVDSSYFAGGVYNFALLAGFAYAANGLAVVDFWLSVKIKNNYTHTILMIFLVFAAFISSVFMSAFNALSILFFIGLIDTNIDFRKIHKLR